jgi:hypothetical protein
MDRKARRRRERMILAASAQPFVLNASALVQIEAAKGDPDAPVPVSIDAYNGGVMSVTGIGPLVCDVTGVEATGPVVLLDGHTNTLAATLGSATVQAVNGERLAATGLISRTNAIAATAIRLASEGVPLQASIGAEPTEPPVRIRPGQTVEVNGRSITAGPAGFLLFKATRLRHIAILPNGADASTTVSIAAAAANNEGAMDFQAWVESRGFVYADLTPEQTAALQVAYDEVSETETPAATEETPAEPVTAAATAATITADTVSKIRAQAAAEAARIGMIQAACGDKHSTIAAKAIAEGWDKNKVELEVIRASRPNLPAIHAKENNVNEKIIEASLCMAAGIPVEAAGYSEETLDRAHKLRRRGLRWHAEQIAAAKGVSIDADPGTLPWIQAAFSTSELSGIVGNVANKALQTAFQMSPSVAEKIAAKKSHNNFQPNTVYSLALNGELQLVSKDGELKHLRLTEESRTRQVQTRGAVLSITRQDLINDDLNAFADNAQALGRKASHSRERAVFAALNATGNGASFFTAARGNYFEGAATNLQSSSLATAVQLFRDQVGPDGLPVMVEPSILLTATANEVAAKELMSSQYLLGPTTAKNPSANVWQGAFTPMVSPWLGSAANGGSATAWYLLGNPADLAAVEIAYLAGQETPNVEFFGMDTNPEVLGVSWRVFYDFGVALGEYRAGVKSKGAA